jgi:branched-chain amino acid transport system substrate-binding protein
MSVAISRRAALAATAGAMTWPLTDLRAQGANPITIGCGLSLTGALASTAKSVLLSAQIFVEDINAKGGVLGRPILLIHYDDQSNPANAPRIYTKLIDVDKVDLVVTSGTNLTTPAMPVVMERNKLIMATLALAVNDKFRYPRFFQTMPYGPQGAEAISAGFFESAMSMNPKPRTVALVGADAEFSKTAVSGAREQAKKRGLRIVYDRTYPPPTVDFGPIIRGIAASSPDIVYIGSYPIDSSGMIRAARELGFKPMMFGGGMVGTQVGGIKADLGEQLNDVVSYELYVPAMADKLPLVEPLIKRYQARAAEAGVDQLGYYVPPQIYATFEILAQAVAATGGVDQDKLASFIRATTFKTLYGDIAFGPDGEWKEPRMLTVQYRGLQGQGLEQFKRPDAHVILHPPAYKTGELRAPFAGGKA